jgi:hypothetical protein
MERIAISSFFFILLMYDNLSIHVMLTLEKRAAALVRLGEWLKDCAEHKCLESPETLRVLNAQHAYNPWLIEPFVMDAFKFWGKRLSQESLSTMILRYPELKDNRPGMHVAVVPDKNIPLAGVHDLICVILAGHHFYCRNINHEHDLLKYLTDQLVIIEPALEHNIYWCDSFPKDVDAYLIFATSQNEHTLKQHFEKRNSLIRQKRFSVGIIAPGDGFDDFKLFGHDIFTFFGLSSRCVRKIFVPERFSIKLFYEAIEEFSHLYQHNRYANNYDYHRSVFMMERIPFFDNGFLILRESSELHVPIGCLYYEYYDFPGGVSDRLKTMETSVQMIATNITEFNNAVKPGFTHEYQLWDFEDKKDIISFLLEKHS